MLRNHGATGGTAALPVCERHLFIFLATLVLAYIAARAVLVPFVHDEARTFFLYTQSGSFLPPDAKPDAANHLLVTAVAWPLYKLFGAAPWVLRGFSVACFILYTCYVMRIGAWVRSTMVRWCMWAALLCTPSLLEFFGLYRGYGPSLAFLLMGVVHLVQYVRDGGTRQFVLAVIAIVLATAASLTLLVPAGIMMALLLWSVWRNNDRQRWARTAIWLLLGSVPLAFLTLHALDLSTRGLLYHGLGSGLFRGTLRSLTMCLYDNSDAFVRWVMVVPLALGVAAAAMARTGNWKEALRPMDLLLVLFLSELSARWVLHAAFGILYPIDRGAFHLVLVAVLLMALALDHWAAKWRGLQWVALGLLAIPAGRWGGVELHRTLMWPVDGVDGELLSVVHGLQAAADRPLVIGADPFLKECIAYESCWRGWKAPIVQDNLPFGHQDVLFVNTSPADGVPGYRSVAGKNGMAVFERESAISLALLSDTLLPPGEGIFLGGRFPCHALNEGPVLVELEAVLQVRGDALDLCWVVESKNDSLRTLSYDLMDLVYGCRRAVSDTLRISRWVPASQEHAAVVEAYFWDPKERGMTMEHCRIRLWRPVHWMAAH